MIVILSVFTNRPQCVQLILFIEIPFSSQLLMTFDRPVSYTRLFRILSSMNDSNTYCRTACIHAYFLLSFFLRIHAIVLFPDSKTYRTFDNDILASVTILSWFNFFWIKFESLYFEPGEPTAFNTAFAVSILGNDVLCFVFAIIYHRYTNAHF